MDSEQQTNQEQKGPASEVKKAPLSLRAIIGEKVGMTQLFTAQGEVVPVTAVKAGPCPIVALRGRQKEGYSAAQIGYGALRQKNASKPLLGQFKKAGVEPVRLLKEFHLADGKDFQVGQYVTLEGLFKPGDYVDVRGISKGKGFAGGMKRHGFRGGPASHGQSDRARAPGSLASRRSLGRVLPGQRMAGHLGAEWVSVQKLEVAEVAPQQNMIYIKGALPGSNRSLVIIQETVKSAKFKRVAPAAQPPAAKKAAKPEKGGGKAAKPAAKAEKGEKKK